MTADEIGLMDIDGNMLENQFKPSIETAMHLEIHKRRPDVNAVVHAHPVTASAFAATNLEIDSKLILEASVMLGEISYPEFKPMGSSELAETVAAAVESANCAVMRNHGALTVGTNMLEAFERLEVLENAAKMTMLTLGPLQGHAIHVDAS
jgi:L-fuculose-phosphate aldolase